MEEKLKKLKKILRLGMLATASFLTAAATLYWLLVGMLG
jgi:hypothetical protein